MGEYLLKIFGDMKYKSRDKSRIKKFLKRFQESWETEPDLRFGQMFMILTHDKDCWNWEIDQWYSLLDNFDNPETIVAKNENLKSSTSLPSISSDSTSIS